MDGNDLRQQRGSKHPATSGIAIAASKKRCKSPFSKNGTHDYAYEHHNGIVTANCMNCLESHELAGKRNWPSMVPL